VTEVEARVEMEEVEVMVKEGEEAWGEH